MPLPVILRGLRRNVTPQSLVNLEIAPFLPLLIGLSQAVSGGVSRSRCITLGMASRGTRRLQELHAAAPRLLNSLEQLFPDNFSTRLSYSSEEMALIQALVEFFLGWVLYLLGQIADPQAVGISSPSRQSAFPRFLTLSPNSGHLKCPTPT
jgi:hypothetical protein